MSSPFSSLLGEVGSVRGVAACMVVDEADGLIIDSALQAGMRGPVVAALAASLYRKARLSAAAAGFGGAGFMQLDAEEGRLCAVGRGGLVLVVVAGPGASVGLVRIEMLRAWQALG